MLIVFACFPSYIRELQGSFNTLSDRLAFAGPAFFDPKYPGIFFILMFSVSPFYPTHFSVPYPIFVQVCKRCKNIPAGPSLSAGRRYRVIHGS